MKTRAAVIHEMEKPRPYAVSKPLVIETLDLDPPGVVKDPGVSIFPIIEAGT
jgi:alcohol dehydrogenase